MAGHIALRQLVHLDVSIFTELRRRQDLEDEKNETRKREPSGSAKKTKKGVCIQNINYVLICSLGISYLCGSGLSCVNDKK